MQCNCQHENICKLRSPLIKAISPLLEIMFPYNVKWRKVEEFIKEICRYRKLLEVEEVKNNEQL